LSGRRITLGSISVGCRVDFEAMNRAIATHRLHPVIDRTFSFAEANAAFRHFEGREAFWESGDHARLRSLTFLTPCEGGKADFIRGQLEGETAASLGKSPIGNLLWESSLNSRSATAALARSSNARPTARCTGLSTLKRPEQSPSSKTTWRACCTVSDLRCTSASPPRDATR
jgi:hypothetical protein